MELPTIPTDPGCYLYKDKEGTIIYVGKAKNLRKRVKSYFQKNHKDDKTEALVKNIAYVEFFATKNEVEALILESNLIKKYKPKYNIDLKDSRRFAHLVVTDEKFPRILTARDKDKKGTYYGPYVNAELRETTRKVLNEIFRIRTCNKLPKKECLRYHLELCSAPCIKEISKEDYENDVKRAEKYLKGNTKQLIKTLETEMKQAAQRQEYERAKTKRDQIKGLQGLQDKQNVELDKRYDEDIINYIIQNDKVYLIVFNVIKGMLATKREFSFDQTPDFLSQFITQYYAGHEVPRELILPEKPEEGALKNYLEELRGAAVRITVAKRGSKKQLLDLVKRNVEISFLQEDQMTNELRKALRLNINPYVIECFDISNLGQTHIVASMVQFRGAKPDKSNYRRFKIRSTKTQDDFASMKEVVKRRYYRLKMEDAPLPDLIVIDGGKGQLSAALEALEELELKIPTISLAKKFEEIYFPGRMAALRLAKDSKALKLLIQLRNEAHRFALKYHRLLRSKAMKNEI